MKVDVIVNTVSPKLELRHGFLSHSILTSAGHTIQQECNLKYKKGIQHGEIAITSAGNLHEHKYIFHCALPIFEKYNVTAVIL